MTQLTFPSGQTTIRISAEEPTPAAQNRLPAIIFLHGSGGNLDFWITHFGPVLSQTGMALYAPHYFEKTNTVRADLTTIRDGIHVPQWLTAVEQAVRFVAARPGVDPERIALAGVSLGAFLALAFGAQMSGAAEAEDRARIRAIIALSGGLVSPFAEVATAAFPPTLILHGAEDAVVPASYATALDAKLTALDVAHRTEILPGENHWFRPAALPRLLQASSSFLAEHLQTAAAATPAM